ncbi:MAG: hypothetical protein ACE5R4_15560 [Armatimonadota bacterium]
MITTADRDLIEKLHSRTLAGKLTWEQAGDWELIAVLPNKQRFHVRRIEVHVDVPPPGREPYSTYSICLTMFDPEGTELLEITTGDLREDDPLHRLLFDLHAAAMRSDEHVKQQLQEAMDALDDL